MNFVQPCKRHLFAQPSSRVLGWWLFTTCNSHDCCMQGFASGDLERDATAIRMFADDGMEMVLAQSYAKNMVLRPHQRPAMLFGCSF